MKRILSFVVLLALTVFTFACATAPAAPAIRGTIASIDGHAVTVTPADGGQPVNLNLAYGTEVFWANGVKATGHSVLVAGQPVQVWTKGDVVTKVVITQ
ncbi:MAG: hypothetical protein ACXW5U_13555 [Thermoanaerobaculia bacterium]